MWAVPRQRTYDAEHTLVTVAVSCCIYTGRSDVTESMVTIRSPFCGYNTT